MAEREVILKLTTLEEHAEGWQPIETAPKDGTGFIYFQPMGKSRKRIGVAVFDDGNFKHVDWNSEEPTWLVIEPTHWRHLPPSPQEGE